MKKYKGGKTDWVGKKLTSQFFPQGKNGPAWFFPGEKIDWGGNSGLLHRTTGIRPAGIGQNENRWVSAGLIV